MEAVIVKSQPNRCVGLSVRLAIFNFGLLLFALAGCNPNQLAEFDEHAGHSHESNSTPDDAGTQTNTQSVDQNQSDGQVSQQTP